MISRIEGVLEAVQGGSALLCCDHLTYEVLIPGIDQQRLATMIGERITLETLHYLETQGQGASFVPRLIGFQSARDRAFFILFTTVKGVGNRKALRTLQMPFDRVAQAIATKDADFLRSLPEVGKRTAETIVAELHGKVDAFVHPPDGSSPGSQPDAAASTVADEAVAVLTSLGEPKLQVLQLVDRAIQADPKIESAEDLVAAVYRLRDLP